jgi:glycosyltransferase involved in cell wall biosynthesis
VPLAEVLRFAIDGMDERSMNNRPERSNARLTVIVPVQNRAGSLPRLLGDLRLVLADLGCRWNILVVDDGSSDCSRELLEAMAFADRRLRVVRLSRCFGRQAAIQAGLGFIDGDAVVVIDGDGRDDPLAIKPMFERWLLGDDVVCAARLDRQKGPLFAWFAWAIQRLVAGRAVDSQPAEVGNYSLLDRKVASQLLAMEECDRYLPTLRGWVGFRQSMVYVPGATTGRELSWRSAASRLGLLAKHAFLGSSLRPLQVFYGVAILALVTSIVVFAGGLSYCCWNSLPFPADTAIASGIAFFGALNALGFAMVGEYLTRIYDQVRGRPPFLVETTTNIGMPPIVSGDKDELQGILKELDEIRQEFLQRRNDAGRPTNDPLSAKDALDKPLVAWEG